MKKSIAKRWIKALRSGEYEQGREVLRTSDGKFCCLGVLADMYRKERKKGWDAVVKDPTGGDAKGTNYYYPSEAVCEWAGLNEYKGTPRGGVRLERGSRAFGNLAQMNDEGCTFNMIADMIEKHVEKL